MFHIKRKSAPVSDAEKALAEAQLHVQIVEARGAEVHELATSMREVRQRNHFAEQLATLIERRR